MQPGPVIKINQISGSWLFQQNFSYTSMVSENFSHQI